MGRGRRERERRVEKPPPPTLLSLLSIYLLTFLPAWLRVDGDLPKRALPVLGTVDGTFDEPLQ